MYITYQHCKLYIYKEDRCFYKLFQIFAIGVFWLWVHGKNPDTMKGAMNKESLGNSEVDERMLHYTYN